jgi:hypothetical protein
MPVLDHSSQEVQDVIEFESFHHHFATQIAVDLNKILPKGFRARAKVHVGPIEVDVRADAIRGASANLPQYKAPKPAITSNAHYPEESFEVLVNYTSRRKEITVGAIEIVSRRNKDRAEARTLFVAKCTNLLSSGVSLIVVDLLRLPAFNLHNELLENLQITEGKLEGEGKPLYCCSYRPYVLDAPQLEVWSYLFNVGEALPEPPLFLTTECAVPVPLEQSYITVYHGLKLDEDLEMGAPFQPRSQDRG